CDIFTTLLAANAHAGTRKNKNALRKIDNLITSQNRSGHIDQSQRICKSAFHWARRDPVATGSPQDESVRCADLWPVVQIAGFRERTAHRAVATGPPRPKARSRSGTIWSPAFSRASLATFYCRPDGGQRFVMQNRCSPAHFEKRYLLLADKPPPAVRRGCRSWEGRRHPARSDRKDSADNSRS